MLFNGYETKTTFWQDFTVADWLGLDAIRDTFNRIFNKKKRNTVYLTELVMVLNWKIWQHYENGNKLYAKLYNELWEIADSYAVENLTGDDLTYFYNTTD